MERRKKNTARATATATVKAAATKAKETVKEVVKTVETAKITGTAIEMPGLSVTMTSIKEAVKKAVDEKKIAGKEISIYVNAVQKAAYYTVDGQGSDDYTIDLATL